MRNSTIRLVLLTAVLSTTLSVTVLSVLPASAQVLVGYKCARPHSGSPCIKYKWYVCWPDSNTLTLAATTTDTFAAITHTNSGERVRVAGVDSNNRTGPNSIASAAWYPRSPTVVPDAPGVVLHPNFPNPFNPSTTITFDLPRPMRVSLSVYSLSGRLLRTLIDADLPAGAARAAWNGTDEKGQPVASGAYLCRMTAGGETRLVRMLLVR